MAEDWLADVRKYVADADGAIVGAIVNYCGIALQSRDSALVAMSDKTERELVRENYLKKKLGLTRSDAELDEAVVAVGERMKADRTKNRVTVYYLLAEHFGSLGLFGGATRGSTAGAALAGGAAGLAAISPTVVGASSERVTTPQRVYGGGATAVADKGFFGRGCGIALLVLGALMLAGLLLWAASRYWATRAPTPVPAASGPVVDPAAQGSSAIPQGSGVIASEVEGKPKLTVYFDVGKSAVTSDLATAAAALKDYVAKNPTVKLGVSGYNDPTGNAASNAVLSKNRAQAVGKALEAVGIPSMAIALEQPLTSTDLAVNAAEARRVEVVVKP